MASQLLYVTHISYLVSIILFKLQVGYDKSNLYINFFQHLKEENLFMLSCYNYD